MNLARVAEKKNVLNIFIITSIFNRINIPVIKIAEKVIRKFSAFRGDGISGRFSPIPVYGMSL